jgi:hypothetical protein
MPPSRWAPIEPLICEFQGFLAPTVPQLKIEKGVDYEDSYPTSKTASPALTKCGVYLIFDDNYFESLRYIGMAGPDRSLIDRIRDHRKSKRFSFTPRWIDVIAVYFPWEFFAPALELYLIDKIKSMKGNNLVNIRGTLSASIAPNLFDDCLPIAE